MLRLDSKLKELKRWVKRHPCVRSILLSFRHPIVGLVGYVYGAYLTIRYVDKYKKFPAIVFRDGLVRLHIRKGTGAKLSVSDRLIVPPLGVTRIPCLIQLGDDAKIIIRGEFIIGADVRIAASSSALIDIGGKNKESGSGLSGGCLVNAYKKIVIGVDVIIAWDTFITDSDWHLIEGCSHQKDTIIGNHVWVAVGAKILKGAVIGDDSIVGCSAVVSSGHYPNRVLLAGVPSKIVKSSIPKWHRDLHEQVAPILAANQ